MPMASRKISMWSATFITLYIYIIKLFLQCWGVHWWVNDPCRRVTNNSINSAMCMITQCIFKTLTCLYRWSRRHQKLSSYEAPQRGEAETHPPHGWRNWDSWLYENNYITHLQFIL